MLWSKIEASYSLFKGKKFRECAAKLEVKTNQHALMKERKR